MAPAQTHAVLLLGAAPTDFDAAYNFAAAVQSCFSRSIIPHVYCNYERSTLFNLLCPDAGLSKPNSDDGGLTLDQATSNPDRRSLSPPVALDMPTRSDVKDMLEILRPYYRRTDGPDFKLELRKAIQMTAEKLVGEDTLLVIIISQGVHTSGCMLLGRPLTNQEIWDGMGSLPVKCTAILAIMTSGSDNRRARADIFSHERSYTGPAPTEPVPDIVRYTDDEPEMPFGKGMYTAAIIEVVKVTSQKNVEHITRKVRDWGTRNSNTDILQDFYPIRLAPWSYPVREWDLVDSVPQAFEAILDKHTPIPQSEHTIVDKIVGTLSISKRLRRRATLYLPVYYFERKLLEMPTDGSSTLSLEGMMRRIIEQSRAQSWFTTVNRAFLFQRRVEETLRFMERTDLRVETFVQCAYKHGAFHRIAVQDLQLDPATQKRKMQLLARRSSHFESVILPPKDLDCVEIEYYTQAYRLVKLIEANNRTYEWFHREKFLDYMQHSL
ncbi:hypothetical protein TWF696_003823 [Orbilia brochopaga]|uniref:Uncharacterized protein n=1 Tax=Orbilia brochopaga TaxID=3140254 RepID=A0AAV9V7B0_9PEZI